VTVSRASELGEPKRPQSRLTTFWAVGGNDILNGLAGNDILDGGKGSDVYIGQEGDDTFIGGGFADQDTADYSSETGGQGIIVNQSGHDPQGLLPPDTVTDTYGHTDSIANVPNLIGSQYDDEIWGGEHANRLEGGSGNDFIFGNDGADTLIGGTGDDCAYAAELARLTVAEMPGGGIGGRREPAEPSEVGRGCAACCGGKVREGAMACMSVPLRLSPGLAATLDAIRAAAENKGRARPLPQRSQGMPASAARMWLAGEEAQHGRLRFR
jgi:hypothetical protein